MALFRKTKGLAGRRAARKKYQQVVKTKPAGEGSRFKALAASAAAGGARNPAAVAAAAGRKKYGQAQMTKWSAAGRRRAR